MTGILGDITVLDLSGITAGGRTTQILADFGARVVKLEGPHRPDPFRHWTAVTGSSGVGDLANPPFRVVNRNKLGLAVDLKRPESVPIVRRLVEESDLVVENFRLGVMDRLGLSFSKLLEWNPRLCLLSLSSQGRTGEEAAYASFGSTLEALSGMMSMTGYDVTTPTWSTNKLNYPDQVVSLLGPGLAVWGVMQSRLHGSGQWINLSQRDLVTHMLGEFLVHTSQAGAVPTPSGNEGSVAVDFCCPCSDGDSWVALTVATDADWAALCRCLGRTDLVDDPRYATADARRSRYEEIDDLVATWTSLRTRSEATAALGRSGLVAQAVLSAHEAVAALQADGFEARCEVDLPSGGRERHLTWPVTIDPDAGAAVRARAPHLGEHSRECLRAVGFDDAQIDRWAADGVVSMWEGA